MIESFLSKQERQTLQRLRDRLKKTDGKGCIRVCVILSLDEGLNYQTIETVLGVSGDTIRRYKKYYEEGGVDLLLENNYKAYKGRLSVEQLNKLDRLLSEKIYKTTKEVIALIAKEFGVKYSESQVSRILHKLGYSYKKPKQYPAKSDKKKQLVCVAQIEEQLAQSAENKSVVLFADSVHPLHNTKPDYGWIKKGQEKWIPSNGGRRRYNLTGVINAKKPEQVTLINAKSINEDVIIELLKEIKIRYNYYDKVYIWSDQATYYTSKKVKDWIASQNQIELNYLPPYSPNLNLIERLWKFMRKKVINSIYYETYKDFVFAIESFFRDIKDYKQELRNLITLNFQFFN
jgi:transposase